jgi:hypothetical protein
MKIKPRKQFLTGSSLVLGLHATDRDIVCLFKTVEEINEFAIQENADKEMYGEDALFLAFRKGNVNYLCTKSLEFFYRFKAYSGALDRLQLHDKNHRVELAKACLYFEPPKE